MENYKKIIELLNQMTKNAEQITELWNELPFGYHAQFSEEYKLDESFDEIVIKLQQWNEHQQNQIK